MALKELNLNIKKPKNLSKDEEFDDNDTLEIELDSGDDDVEEDFENIENDRNQSDGEMEEDLQQDDNEDQGDEDDDGSEEDVDEEGRRSPKDDEEDSEDEDEQPRGRRENHRIRTLVEERNRERAVADEERKARKDTEKRLLELQKTTVESGKNLLKSHITSIKSQLEKAHEESNPKLLVDLTEQLNKAQNDLAVLDNWKEPTPEPEEDKPRQQQGPRSIEEAPHAVQNWARKNPWFQNPVSTKDKERQEEAVIYSERLAKQGYSIGSKEMFDLIDERLEKLGLASKSKTSVKSKTKEGNNSSSSEDGRKKPKKISQRFQGGSRSPKSQQHQSSKRTVRLTVEQQELADLYGLTHAEYAEEVWKIEQAEKQGKRMVPIFGNKK